MPYFVQSGLVREDDRAAFRGVVLDLLRLRDATFPWAMIAGVVLAWHTVSLYDAVQKMRVAPIGMRSLAPILIPVAVPMLVVAAIEVPIGELLLKLVSTLA